MARPKKNWRASTSIFDQVLPEIPKLPEPTNLLTLIICSSFSPIQITILSPNGTDLTPFIPILHSHISPSTLQQRSYTSMPIRGCSQDDTYTSRSWCHHELSPQDFETLCKEPQQGGRTNPQERTYIGGGKCSDDELCVGSNTGNEDTSSQAYCVSMNHFLRIPSSGRGQSHASSGVVTASFNPALYNNNGSHVAVEAVLTYPNKRWSLSAASMVMQAQTYSGAWRTVANGSNYCMGCSSVGLEPFPVTARRVKVDVVMPDWSPMGLLWLASYSY